MNNDLIKRGLAISYAVSGMIRRIDGEEWIRRSDVRQSLYGVPAEPQDCSDCMRYDSPYFEIKIDEEQLQELVDKAKAEVLASIELGEWIPVSERLPEKKGYFLTSTVFNDVYCDFWNGEEFERTEMILAWMPLPEPYKKEGDKE